MTTRGQVRSNELPVIGIWCEVAVERVEAREMRVNGCQSQHSRRVGRKDSEQLNVGRVKKERKEKKKGGEVSDSSNDNRRNVLSERVSGFQCVSVARGREEEEKSHCNSYG